MTDRPPRGRAQTYFMASVVLIAAGFSSGFHAIPDVPENAPPDVTTIYIVRHAERQDSSSNSPLSEAGLARAKHLARVLADDDIAAVFVTQFLRTQQTGAEVAAAAKIAATPYTASDAQELAEKILSEHNGKHVLVVGHSDTVADIANALGIDGLTNLHHDEYDRLFVIQHIDGSAHLNRLRYGAENP